MDPWLSWGLVLALAGGLYFYYTQNAKSGSRGRTLQRGDNADVQWSDAESKTKNTGKAAKTKAKAPRKSVKKAVQEVGDKAGAALSVAASYAGAGADDDTSPTSSPLLGEKLAAAVPSGRDVSDMLENAKSLPSVLRIGASEKPARPAKPQQQRPETPVETKKQRQNKKKNDDSKAAREAAEEERKKLLEKQRRTAREARGEPAKNGVVPSSAWSHTPVQATSAQPSPMNGQLLDTIDNVSTASSSGAATSGTDSTLANLPSEEDQMKQIIQDDNWTTVEKAGKKAKKNAADEGIDSGAVQEPVPVQVKVPAKPAPVKKENKPLAASRFEVLSNPTGLGHPLDSDWPVV